MNAPLIFPYQSGRTSEDVNRANEMRRDDDIVRVPAVTLYDIDYAVLYGLNSQIKPTVVEDGHAVKVPVIYLDGEKFNQIRRNGFMRDLNNKVISPVIGLKRMGVNDDDRLPHVNLNNYTPTRKLYPYRSMNMQYDRVTGQILRKHSYEYYLVNIPRFVKVDYDITIWCDFVEHLNIVAQSLFSVNNHLWGDYYKFRVYMGSLTDEVTSLPGEQRIVKATIPITVDGYLLDEFQYSRQTMQKKFSIKTVKIVGENEADDIFINDTSMRSDRRHMTEEPSHVLRKNLRRNIRY